MNTQEGNKLIAEFMGHDYMKGNYLKYHESWDWLMPVVEELSKYTGGTIISESLRNGIAKGLCEVNIEKTWKACIEFIEWINKHSKDSKEECKKEDKRKCEYPHCECMPMLNKPE